MVFKMNNQIYRENDDGQIEVYDTYFKNFVPSTISYNDYVTSKREIMPEDFMKTYYYLVFDSGSLKIFKTIDINNDLDRFNKAFGNKFITKEQALAKAEEILNDVQ